MKAVSEDAVFLAGAAIVLSVWAVSFRGCEEGNDRAYERRGVARWEAMEACVQHHPPKDCATALGELRE